MDKLGKLCQEPAYVCCVMMCFGVMAVLIILAAILIPDLVRDVKQLDAIDKPPIRKRP